MQFRILMRYAEDREVKGDVRLYIDRASQI